MDSIVEMEEDSPKKKFFDLEKLNKQVDNFLQTKPLDGYRAMAIYYGNSVFASADVINNWIVICNKKYNEIAEALRQEYNKRCENGKEWSIKELSV